MSLVLSGCLEVRLSIGDYCIMYPSLGSAYCNNSRKNAEEETSGYARPLSHSAQLK